MLDPLASACIVENMALAATDIGLGHPTEPLTKEKELKQTIKINTIK